jgi:uncharacterized protein (TIGR02246 family)
MTSILALISSFFIFLGQMNLEPNIQVMVKRQALAWETEDVSSIVRDFAPNAIFKAGDSTFQGVEAIKKSAEDYFREFTEIKITIKRIIINANQGAIEWDWSDRHRKTGQVSQAEDAIIFELQDDNKISYWREYIEKKK